MTYETMRKMTAVSSCEDVGGFPLMSIEFLSTIVAMTSKIANTTVMAAPASMNLTALRIVAGRPGSSGSPPDSFFSMPAKAVPPPVDDLNMGCPHVNAVTERSIVLNCGEAARGGRRWPPRAGMAQRRLDALFCPSFLSIAGNSCSGTGRGIIPASLPHACADSSCRQRVHLVEGRAGERGAPARRGA